jgi:hypothetical protein
MARLTTEERGSIALANLAIFFSTYIMYLGYLIVGSFENALPVGSLQAEQGSQLNQIVNSSASAIGLSNVMVIIAISVIIFAALFILMQFSTHQYYETYG